MSGVAANMRGMAGFPMDEAHARRLVAREGRPMRMAVWCLVNGLPADAWRPWSRERQEEILEPYVGEGERVRFGARTGEGAIVGDGRGNGAAGTGGRSVRELRDARAMERLLNEATREGMAQGYAQATARFAAQVVELEEQLISAGLDEVRVGADGKEFVVKPDVADKRLAFSVVRDWKDRTMGKAVAQVEVSGGAGGSGGGSVVQRMAAKGALPVSPLSADWTIEGVAAAERAALEEGEGDGGE